MAIPLFPFSFESVSWVLVGRSEQKWKNKTRIIEIGGSVPQDHGDAAWNQQHMVTKISPVENECDGRYDNKSKIKGCLWLTCGLIILEMKADNDPAFSLSVYYKSVKKWKYVKKSKTKKKREKENLLRRESNSDLQRLINCTTTATVKQDC